MNTRSLFFVASMISVAAQPTAIFRGQAVVQQIDSELPKGVTPYAIAEMRALSGTVLLVYEKSGAVKLLYEAPGQTQFTTIVTETDKLLEGERLLFPLSPGSNPNSYNYSFVFGKVIPGKSALYFSSIIQSKFC